MTRKIAVLGAGGWGTALSILWAKKKHNVRLWGHTAARVEQLCSARENSDYLPGIPLPEAIGLTSDLADCADADLFVFATPSTALRKVATSLRSALSNDGIALLSCTKGIEHGSGMRMSEILRSIFPSNPIAVLSGPNLAPEVARELPTATVLACVDTAVTSRLQQDLGTSRLRIYSSEDVAAVELGGALKNVFAIAAGASDGLGLGDNSKAALVTRSLAEMIRLGTAMGGKTATFSGLSGVGDLILTCFSQHSRNRRVGEQIGHGQTLDQIASTMKMVAEGVPTARSALECARKLNVETPIIDQVYSVIWEGKMARDAMEELLRREQKPEQV